MLKVLPLKDYTSQELKEIRNKCNYSIELFAEIFVVSIDTIKSWETGHDKPVGTEIRLYQLLDKNPKTLEECGILTKT